MADYIFKICIFGNGGVGKTTLVKRFLTGLFDESTTMTLGVDIAVKYLKINELSISLQIWDFGGEERFRFFLPSYAAGASGGIFMFDTTNTTSFLHQTEWVDIFRKKANLKAPVLMVGGKLDLEAHRIVFTKDAKNLAGISGMYDYIECSSKTGENVELIFENLTEKMMELV